MVPDGDDAVRACGGERGVSGGGVRSGQSGWVGEVGDTYCGWKTRALTGQTWSTSSIVCLWHLNAYFFSCTAGDGSKYSSAILPSTDAVAYPTPAPHYHHSKHAHKRKTLTLAIRHARQRPRHILETTLALLGGGVHLPDIIDVEQPARHADDEGVVHQVEVVDALGGLVRGLLCGDGAGVPEAECAVPGAGDEYV